MNSNGRTGTVAAPPGGGMKAGLLLAGCVTLLALPTAVLAFSTTFRNAARNAGQIDSLDPESPPESLSQAVALRSLVKDQAFPFTPAGAPSRLDRAVTVAVRVDPQAAQAIIVRGTTPLAQTVPETGNLRISSTAFNLGVSRGYQNFAQNLVTPTPSRPMAEVPDLKKFNLAPSTSKPDVARFSPRISVDEKRLAGRAPRTFAADGSEVDLGGAYRVTDHIDVTAGLRYSQDRERLAPLTDGKQDSQAVYVGTQFKF